MPIPELNTRQRRRGLGFSNDGLTEEENRLFFKYGGQQRDRLGTFDFPQTIQPPQEESVADRFARMNELGGNILEEYGDFFNPIFDHLDHKYGIEERDGKRFAVFDENDFHLRPGNAQEEELMRQTFNLAGTRYGIPEIDQTEWQWLGLDTWMGSTVWDNEVKSPPRPEFLNKLRQFQADVEADRFRR